MHQLSLFDAPAPPPVPAMLASVDTWTAQKARIDAALAAGKPEVLLWGKRDGYRGTFYQIKILRDGRTFMTSEDSATPTSGGGGPYYGAHASRDAALLHVLRAKLHRCATTAAGGYGDADAKIARAIAAWCIEQAPPVLFGGEDLEPVWRDLLTVATAKEQRRRAALNAVHEVCEQANAAMNEAGLYGFSGSWDAGLVSNADAPCSGGAGADPVGHAVRWPARWIISGEAPHALCIHIEPRTGQSDSAAVLATVEALRGALSIPVIVDDEEPVTGPYCQSSRWTWDQ
jgi:hypothetical protein